MSTPSLSGHLYLNGQHVGDVSISGWHGPWGFGEFEPKPAYSAFAPLYNEWSRLMHSSLGRLSRENAARLREVENRSYALHAQLWLVEGRQWRHIAILNIDGAMIEWKEAWPGGGNAVVAEADASAEPARRTH